MRKYFGLIVLLLVAMIFNNGCKNSNNMEQKLVEFIKQHDAKVIPLFKEANIAAWDASISGKPEDFKKEEDLNMKINAIFSDKVAFKTLKEIKDANSIQDKTLKRELEILYNHFLGAQVDTAKLNAVTKLQTQIEQKYGNFRATVNGKVLTDNQLEELLKTSVDSKELKEAWLAHKKIGAVVKDDLLKIVKMRNDIAKELGFNNYHEMSLKLDEQDPKEIEKIFDELDSLTRGSFADLKGEIDDNFSKRYSVDKKDLMPWHYQNRFFQEAPKLYKVDLDKYYAGKDLAELTKVYYKGIGMPCGDIIKHSDLLEKPGKNQHAFCTDIDHEGDVRVLCNIKPNAEWMGTMLHEFGHGVYFKYLDKSTPFVLREPAHTFTTEAIAMFFGRQSSNPEWIQAMTGISNDEKVKIAEDSHKKLRLDQLVFSRWAQVMYRFEKAMYENPDQDLNKLWWDLVERYQMLKRPADRNEPDYASKIHLALYPCYYHNYLLGEMLASQLSYYITEKVLKQTDLRAQSFANNPEIGKYLIDKVYKPGRTLYWNDMIEQATGEKLTAKYYARQFVTK